MTVKDVCAKIPHGELIVPHGHLVLRSLYQFDDCAEVYAFLHGCKRADCSVCFLNENISVDNSGNMSVPDFVISVYMSLKENPKLVESYLRFLVKAGSKEWALDQVEVIE